MTDMPALLDADMPASEILLHMGEMSTQEINLSREGIRLANRHIARARAAQEDGFPIAIPTPREVADRLAQNANPLSEGHELTLRAAVNWAYTRHKDTPRVTDKTYQDGVMRWLAACFGEEIAMNGTERNHRFLEEALELVQALGCSRSEAHQLVDYTFNRDIGEPSQEVGGVMVTLAAVCGAYGLDMMANGETELARVWTKVEKIRKKQAAKPKHSPLPASDEAISVAAIKDALEPVFFWYQSDEHEDRPIRDILRDIATDLEDDRKELIALRAENQPVLIAQHSEK